MSKAKRLPCPECGHNETWLCHVISAPGVLKRFYLECQNCYYCSATKIGKRRAIKEWNKEAKTYERTNH